MVSPGEAPPTVRRRWTLALTGTAFFMVVLDALAVTTALPAIHRDLGASLPELQWTLSAYMLAWAAAITTAAACGDRFGRRRVFALGLCIFALASASCALATSVGGLIAARAAQGAGAGVIMPLSLTILTTSFPPERRGTMIGLWGAIAGIAAMAGPIVGGALTQGLSWQWIFWVNVPIGVVAAALVRLRLTETLGPPTRIDPLAIVLVSTGAAGVVLGLVRAAERGWTDLTTGAILLVSLALIAGFIAWEQRVQDPMMPPRLFHSVSFSAANATNFFMTAAQYAAAFFIVQYFQVVLGETPLATGIRLLPWVAPPLVINPLVGMLSDRFGPRALLTGGMLLQALGFIAFATVAAPGVAYWLLALSLVVAAVGGCTVVTVAPAAALSAIPPADIGKGSAVNSMFQRFGSSFGVAVSTASFAVSGSLTSAATFSAGFRPAMTVAAGLALVGAFTARGVARKRSSAPKRASNHEALAPAEADSVTGQLAAEPLEGGEAGCT